MKNPRGWNAIESLQDLFITKIACGAYHTLFLEDNGNVWATGYESNGRLGIGGNPKGDDEFVPPTKIGYFVENKIKIIDFACGEEHNLAISDIGKAYSWGYNADGRCGHGHDDDAIDKGMINKPKLIEALINYNIDRIRAGQCHSYL